MLTLLFRDAGGNERVYIRNLYDVRFSSLDKGGPTALTAAIPVDLVAPKIGLLYEVSLYDELDEIWLGRVVELPNATKRQAGLMTAEGYIKHLADNKVRRMFSDTGYSGWSTVPPTTPTAAWQWDFCERDNNNRVYLRIGKDRAADTNLTSGVYYTRSLPSGIDQAVYSVAFDYETGAAYDSAKSIFRLISYSADFSASVNEWSLAGSGALSGSVTELITASKKGLAFCLVGVAAHTPTNNNFWAKATNVRVNGLSAFTGAYQADEVIKNYLTTYCPKISTDQTQIANGSYTLPDWYEEGDLDSLAVLKRLNALEDYNFGCWDRDSSGNPRMYWAAHDKTTVHYTTSLRYALPDLAGDSLDEQYNRVIVGYRDATTERSLYVTRSVANDVLDDAGITRYPDARIEINSSSQTAANRAGDIFLTDKGRAQGRGSLTVRGPVEDQYGRKVAPWRIRPGRNIHVRDLRAEPQTLTDMTSSNVLNGKNIFRIIQVDANPAKGEAILQLDNAGDRLDLFLARRRY